MTKKNSNIAAGRHLSEALRTLAAEEHDIGTSDNLTRAECLAKIVWDYALGFTRKVKNKEGKLVNEVVGPKTWAIDIIFDRLIGRVAQQGEDTQGKAKLVDRVEEIDKKQFQNL